LGDGQPPRGNQSPQHLRDLREDPAFDPRSGYLLFWPWLCACRASLFLPATALVPTALGALIFKLVDRLQQAGHMTGLVFRPSETIETYLYFFILAYLIVFARRIK
jgi:hypothetical protein